MNQSILEQFPPKSSWLVGYSEIVWYNADILRKKSTPVKEVDAEFGDFLHRFKKTIQNRSDCAGLSANQVNFDYSVIGVKQPDNEVLILINPEIVRYSEETNSEHEGCLSVPGIHALVERSSTIEVKFRDITFMEQQQEFTGFVARVIQHEVDHLNGLFFFDRVSKASLALITNKLRLLAKNERKRRHGNTAL